MRRLLINQDQFSFKTKFSVNDEAGNECYRIEGKKIFTRSNILVYNTQNEEVARISERIGMNFSYELLTQDGKSAVIRPRYKLTRTNFEVDGQDIELIGNISGLNYAIMEKGVKIGEISSKLFSMYSKYVVDIYDERCELLILALVLAVSFMNANTTMIGAMAGG
jgi:uncharacterized protein YxjI